MARSSELLTACHIDLIRYSFGEECRYVYIHLDGECLDGHLLDDEWTEFYAEELRVGGLEVNLTLSVISRVTPGISLYPLSSLLARGLDIYRRVYSRED